MRLTYLTWKLFCIESFLWNSSLNEIRKRKVKFISSYGLIEIYITAAARVGHIRYCVSRSYKVF